MEVTSARFPIPFCYILPHTFYHLLRFPLCSLFFQLAWPPTDSCFCSCLCPCISCSLNYRFMSLSPSLHSFPFSIAAIPFNTFSCFTFSFVNLHHSDTFLGEARLKCFYVYFVTNSKVFKPFRKTQPSSIIEAYPQISSIWFLTWRSARKDLQRKICCCCCCNNDVYTDF